ncbi:MAG: sel1 repeat family protein [Thermoguttaceae bacterium]|nr:sel1 repeat family protein [Thermoguttaceae bacterium]
MAFESQKYVENLATKLPEYLQKAESGDVEAMKKAGEAYAAGGTKKPDYKKARHWYAKASAEGDVDAIERLADLLVREATNPKSFFQRLFFSRKKEFAMMVQAFKLFQLAAEKGNATAMCKLGQFAAAGVFEPPNPDKALEYFKKAADLGDRAAMVDIGSLYYEQEKYKEGVEWYGKAAKLGDAKASYNIGLYFEQIVKDYPKAAGWYRRSAEGGIAEAATNIAYLYAKGLGCSKNLAEALEWYAKGSELGDPAATLQLAEQYRTGDGVPKDSRKAAELEKLAKKQSGPWNAGVGDGVAWE